MSLTWILSIREINFPRKIGGDEFEEFEIIEWSNDRALEQGGRILLAKMKRREGELISKYRRSLTRRVKLFEIHPTSIPTWINSSVKIGGQWRNGSVYSLCVHEIHIAYTYRVYATPAFKPTFFYDYSELWFLEIALELNFHAFQISVSTKSQVFFSCRVSSMHLRRILAYKTINKKSSLL